MYRCKKYTEDYEEMISDLYNSGITISEISSEYDWEKSTINGWVKVVKEIKISENEVITLKEVAKLKRKMKYYSEASFS